MEQHPARDPADPLIQLLSNQSQRIQDLACAARDLIRKKIPDVHEFIDRRARLAAYGYSDRYADLICTLQADRGTVTLGLVHGEGVRDPRNLLQGIGDLNRHVVLESDTDLERPGLPELITSAHAAWKKRRGS